MGETMGRRRNEDGGNDERGRQRELARKRFLRESRESGDENLPEGLEGRANWTRLIRSPREFQEGIATEPKTPEDIINESGCGTVNAEA